MKPHTLKFLSKGANALIVGKPGNGKCHIAKAVAYLQATLQGHDVAYIEADSEFARYALTYADERARARSRARWPPICCCSMTWFLTRRISEHAAELL